MPVGTSRWGSVAVGGGGGFLCFSSMLAFFHKNMSILESKLKTIFTSSHWPEKFFRSLWRQFPSEDLKLARADWTKILGFKRGGGGGDLSS